MQTVKVYPEIPFDATNPNPNPNITLTYKNKHYVTSYLSLFSGIGKLHVNEGNYISREEYPEGYCLYVFDITGSRRKDFLDLTRKGHTRLSINFEETPTETLTAVVYSCFPSIFQIDETRNIIT